MVKKIWGNESLYRVGGDEFVAVCFNMKKETAEEKKVLFEREMKNNNWQNNGGKIQLQMAIGISEYNSEIDKEYMEVFRRADSAMYEDKKQKKRSKEI